MKKLVFFSENLNKLFPQADEIFNEKSKEVDEILIPNFEKLKGEFDKGETPTKLEFFLGGKNENFKNKLMQLGIDQKDHIFL